MPSLSTGADKFFAIVILMNSVDLTFIDFPNQVLRFESVISPTVGKEKGYNFIIILTAYIIRASRNLSYILQIPPCSASSGQVRGRHDALPSLCLNSRVLPRSLSFCPRSGEGSFCRPTLLPWCRSTWLSLTPAAYLSCHSCRGLLP